jgi:hypothetical protein
MGYRLHIQHEAARLNIALVIEIFRRERSSHEHKQKALPLALHRETGLLHPLPAGPAQEYKLIDLHLNLETNEAYITEKEFPGQLFNLEELNSNSRHVLVETCHHLKLAMRHLHDLREFAHLELEPSLEGIKSRNLLHGAWHAVTREDAERMLLQTPVGTYLFRKDSFAGCLEEILSGGKKARIKCYTLSYLDPKGQVRDRTMVHWNGLWLFYDDDPSLSGDSYASLDELLFSMGAVLKSPLEAIKIKQSLA